MSQIIHSYPISSWQKIPCVLSKQAIETLCSELAFPVLLDSGHDCTTARYTIFSAAPNKHLLLSNSISGQPDQHDLEQLRVFARQQRAQDIPEDYAELPFVCGLLGYCSYDFGESLHGLKTKQTLDFPSAYIGSYTWSYVYDHFQDAGWLIFSPRCTTELRDSILLIAEQYVPLNLSEDSNQSAPAWKKSLSYKEYSSAFKRIQAYIQAGDCYQVNLTQRFESDLEKLPESFKAIDYFLQKQAELQTPYSAFMSFSCNHKLMCFSPEQFIRIKHRVIESKPIKGTIANTLDLENIVRLKSSLKNQAENVMIVDLLRNDLSKVCEISSVHVPELFKIESFKNVHHMVSHIRGKLRSGISEFEAFLSCFPGGSITGAPKLRAMEIIHELEKHNRSAYCGSVFYWNDNGHFDSNILIRSVIQSGKRLYCWAGGGIVADSELEDEYAESLTKVANLTGITE